MRYRVMRIGYGFEVHFGDERAEIIPDHTIISYTANGLASVFAVLGNRSKEYLEVSEETTKEQLLNALENEVS